MKKGIKRLAVATALMLGLGASGAALAWHGHVGVYVGVPLYSPWYYPRAYYYPPYVPPVVVSQPPVIVSQPPVYVEQGAAEQSAPAPQPQYWYYCSASQAYYPYVKDCPGGWQRVTPQPG